jgi:formylglycine-generating enzyme required for sulfatase activity
MKRWVATVAVLVALAIGTAQAAINVETVPVGNPGNAGELSGASAGGEGPDAIVGSVSYTYNIGKYEVTAGQYTEFLNAVAATDQYELYTTAIQRAGSSGSYTYSVAAEWANRPVNAVSWYDAARFSNWLTTGDTETGVYRFTSGSLTAILDHETAAGTLGGKVWFLPTEDEWYKAAYHKNDGVTGNYWDYPTGTNAVPSNDLIDPDPGNNANFDDNGFTIGGPYFTTEVGEFENSESSYGTFDQGGNLWEWNETLVTSPNRGLRGGPWAGDSAFLEASRRKAYYPAYNHPDIGFRVGSAYEPSAIPEPTTLIIWSLLGGLALTVGWWRRKRTA